MDAVHRYEGYVAQSLGDGIFALCGAPIAHEDHAQRALYAALRMQESITRYADRLRLERGVPVQIRVGVNTDTVKPIPKAPTPEAETQLLRDTGRQVAEGYLNDHASLVEHRA